MLLLMVETAQALGPKVWVRLLDFLRTANP